MQPHADIEEFLRHKDVVLLDNNVLAHPHGIAQIEKMARLGVRVDFNQGLDARMIDDGVARLLGKLKWLHCCASPATTQDDAEYRQGRAVAAVAQRDTAQVLLLLLGAGRAGRSGTGAVFERDRR